MADGTGLGEGRVRIEVRRRVLAVMVGSSEGLSAPAASPEQPTDEAKLA